MKTTADVHLTILRQHARVCQRVRQRVRAAAQPPGVRAHAQQGPAAAAAATAARLGSSVWLCTLTQPGCGGPCFQQRVPLDALPPVILCGALGSVAATVGIDMSMLAAVVITLGGVLSGVVAIGVVISTVNAAAAGVIIPLGGLLRRRGAREQAQLSQRADGCLPQLGGAAALRDVLQPRDRTCDARAKTFEKIPRLKGWYLM